VPSAAPCYSWIQTTPTTAFENSTFKIPTPISYLLSPHQNSTFKITTPDSAAGNQPQNFNVSFARTTQGLLPKNFTIKHIK
jgi:hypothetical protein